MFRPFSRSRTQRSTPLTSSDPQRLVAPPSLIDTLEPRVLLSGDFFAVGMTDDRVTNGVSLYLDDAHLDDNGAITGTRRLDDTLGQAVDDHGTDWASATFDDKGGLRPGHRDSTHTQSHEIGSQFFSRRGFPAGWALGVGNRARLGQFSYLIEKPTDASIEDLSGRWAFNGLHIERSIRKSEDTDALFGTSTVTGSDFTGVWSQRRHGTLEENAFTGTIGSITPSGVITIATNSSDDDVSGSRAYLSRDKSVALWGNYASHDGELSFGVSVKRGTTYLASTAAGSYRVALVLADEVNDIKLANSVAIVDLRLDLKADGTYSAYDLASTDSGAKVLKFSGSWTISNGDEITTTGLLGSLSWVLSSNGSSLLPMKLVDLEGKTRPVSGLGTKFVAQSPITVTPSTATVSNDDNGRAVVYERGRDDIWRKADLAAAAGSPAISGKVSSWIDRRDGLLYASGRSDAGVLLFKRAADATWTFRNLTIEIAGATKITSNVTAFTSITGQVTLAGLNASGELVVYEDSAAVNSSGQRVWTFTNLTTTHITTAGQTMPHLVGDVISYVTSWDGLNIAALDDHGHIQAVWTSPALAGTWILSDLTVATNSSPIQGGLTAYLTPWGGINLSGLDETGRVRVTWWTPGMDNWHDDDLTSSANGSTLVGSSVTSYVNPWGGLNIAGVDDSGHVHIYWWAPGLDHWNESQMTDDSTAEHLRPRSHLNAVTAPDGRSTITGLNSQGQTVALTFELSKNIWTNTNLTETASDY